ncbi:MAG: threonine synthase [Massiliimalia sp.]|jgi:threonine synthase
MLYHSTRNEKETVTAAQAISQGISPEGGLFVPETLPKLDEKTLYELADKSYVERAKYVLGKFLTDFTEEEVAYCAENAYTDQKFDTDQIAEISKLCSDTYMLELWHGPTCAFKDMALQILPYLLTVSAKKAVKDKKIVILVATSGDTGKAALEGFKDVPGTQMLVFYPEDGVSAMQKRQMTTQEGNNVAVCAIKGNFDDAQTGVKQIFTDAKVVEKLGENGMMFSSANSINWGRLLPQIIYYVSSYCQLVKDGELKMSEKLNVVVPTGNFGNILAAYYAKKMGVPLGKLICASNANNVLTDFIRTGTYDRNRPFHATISPSMDILISSNLERLLYDLSGCDEEKIRQWFASLSKEGKYTVDDSVKAKLDAEFYAGCCDDQQTKETIHHIFETYSYLCDTHTAVAVKVAEEYREATGDHTKTLIASTASPYKFAGHVLSSISENVPEDDYDQLEALEKVSGVTAPAPLVALKEKPVRFTGSICKEEMEHTVMEMLGLA